MQFFSALPASSWLTEGREPDVAKFPLRPGALVPTLVDLDSLAGCPGQHVHGKLPGGAQYKGSSEHDLTKAHLAKREAKAREHVAEHLVLLRGAPFEAYAAHELQDLVDAHVFYYNWLVYLHPMCKADEPEIDVAVEVAAAQKRTNADEIAEAAVGAAAAAAAAADGDAAATAAARKRKAAAASAAPPPPPKKPKPKPPPAAPRQTMTKPAHVRFIGLIADPACTSSFLAVINGNPGDRQSAFHNGERIEASIVEMYNDQSTYSSRHAFPC